MREQFLVIYLILTAVLLVCAFTAKKNEKAIHLHVAFLLLSLVFPVVGNMMIVATETRWVAVSGYYIYFIGMDLVMFMLIHFSLRYCDVTWSSPIWKYSIYGLLGVDLFQYLLNPIFTHAFDASPILVDDRVYYQLVPLMGQTFHRIVDYGVYAASLIIFLVMLVKSPKIYAEKYWVILLSMVAGGLWQTFFIFSRTPINQSMIGFVIFGLLAFTFSLYYRPRRLLDRLLGEIVSDLRDAVFFYDASGRCIWANSEGLRLTGTDGKNDEQTASRVLEIFGEISLTAADWAAKKTIQIKGETRHFILEKRTLIGEKEKTNGYYVKIRDNTEEQNSLKRELYKATHDRLTGLYTQEFLYRQIRQKLEEYPKVNYLIVFVDINEFKIVNDVFGSAFGDFAIQHVANWIREGMSEMCVYGRLAGDTFGILIPEEEFHSEELEQVLEDYVVRDLGKEHHLLIHLGVYPVTDRTQEISVMFDRAHLAISKIKGEYRRHITIYDDYLRESMLWEQQISNQLTDAIHERQIQPYLQPIVDTEGRVVGAEALVRWLHPKKGFLSPGAFIPVFEKNGMISDVDRYMWKCACEILAGWWSDSRKDLFLSVNISPKDFYFMDVAKEIRKIVREYRISPERLRLEITESVMMTDMENRIRMIESLRSEGFIVEMDDFGSGYSSFNMLKDMPVDVLKIDMKFLQKPSDDKRAEIILRDIVRMSGDLQMVSLTEGVETREQFNMLKQMGCQLFQGYYFARPMQVDGFEAFCDNQSVSTDQR